MNKFKISAAIATYNEEENIADCLESLKQFCDEIVVVDGSSIDRTREVARRFGAKVIKTTNKKMFHTNKNIAINKCSGDWVFLIDADERVTGDLVREIVTKVNSNPRENGFWINRKNWFLGGYLTKGGAYPNSDIRLFRKRKGRLPEVSVHEQVKVNGKIGDLKSDLLHFADPDFKRYLSRAVRYTDLTAENYAKGEVRVDFLGIIINICVRPVLLFFNIFVVNRGYKDGFRGFVWALFSAAHIYLAYVKYWHKKAHYKVSLWD